MKIKQDSAIYKALKFVNAKAYIDLRINGQTTLCDAASGLFEVCILSAVVLVVSSAAIVSLSALLFTIVISQFTDYWIPGSGELLLVAIAICGILWPILFCLVLKLGLHHEIVTPEYLKKWLNLKDKPSESFLSRWLKDRREKICTIVKLEE